MGQPRLKWGKAKRYLLRHGYELRYSGGDCIIIAPPSPETRSRQALRIGHTSCRNDGTEMLRCYVSGLHRAFGLRLDQLLGD